MSRCHSSGTSYLWLPFHPEYTSSMHVLHRFSKCLPIRPLRIFRLVPTYGLENSHHYSMHNGKDKISIFCSLFTKYPVMTCAVIIVRTFITVVGLTDIDTYDMVVGINLYILHVRLCVEDKLLDAFYRFFGSFFNYILANLFGFIFFSLLSWTFSNPGIFLANALSPAGK